MGQVGQHRRIDLPIMAIEVDQRPRRTCHQHREALRYERMDEEIDPAILQPPEHLGPDARLRQQGGRIDTPGMGDGQNNRTVGNRRAI